MLQNVTSCVRKNKMEITWCFAALREIWQSFTNTSSCSFSEVVMADTDNSSIVEEDEAQVELQLALQR